ncbi:unnamed protein product [Psylliodes chrysocephalus]|uniref:HAT C-terminal dimerisation domain-containing protein n=1 Tax=Psylliodes chrysocephalus TaxID=3402493 RepID=A0A9P0CNF1_9CUCU|nr:unnamed protein product [Psylliodes chrysocephala]
MSFKSKPSGVEFRKRREEKDEKNEKVIKKVPKITTFFNEVNSNAEELAFEPDLVPELQNKSADAEDGVHVVKLQNLSKTRWSARDDACRAVNESREGILKSLDEIASDCDERHSTRNEARIINEKLSSLETTIMAALLGLILERCNKVNVKLQYEITELGKIVAYYDSLCGFLQEVRINFDDLERSAKEKCRREYMADNRRKRKGRRTFNCILDSLYSEIKKRECKYSDLHNRFGFLETIKSLEASDTTKCARELLSAYPEDLEPVVVDECLHLKAVLLKNTENENTRTSMIEISKVLFNFDMVDVYPNIALRMVLSAAATNCSAERSFFTLRRVKNYLRSTTSHNRLTSLAMLAIEGRLTQSISYDDIIDKFARKKARRKAL